VTVPKRKRPNSQKKRSSPVSRKRKPAEKRPLRTGASKWLAHEEQSSSGNGGSVQPVETPFQGNIRAGKNTYVYDAHTYHTKVPPEGIAKLIAHYTRPGEVVLDPFCGSGMTGVAATNLGRKAVLSDLSPAATFIARHVNTPIDAEVYLSAVRQILTDGAALEEKLYGTTCRACGELTPALYTVWSYGVLCPDCGKEFILWDVARDEKPSVRESKILSEFHCPHCRAHLQKRGLKRTRRYPGKSATNAAAPVRKNKQLH